MLTDEVRRAFEDAGCCFLATCDGDGPNVVPVGFKWVEDGDLLLTDLYFDKTRRNLAGNPRVAVAIAGMDPKWGYQMKGTATIHRDGAPFERLRTLLREDGVEAEPHAAVVVRVTDVYLLDPGDEAGRRLPG